MRRNSIQLLPTQHTQSAAHLALEKHFETAPRLLDRNGQRGYVPDLVQIAIGLRHRLITELRKQTRRVMRRSANANHWLAMYNGGLFVSFRGC